MGVTTFTISVDGIRLAGELHLPKEQKDSMPVVVICHGIPAGRPANGDPGYRPLAQSLASDGFMAVLFNFRGCGLSGGNIDLDGWCRDLQGILNMISTRPDVDQSRISLLGFSGGGAVSCKVAASDTRVNAVALMACPAEFSFLFKEQELEEIVARAREIGSIRDADFPLDAKVWLEGLYGVEARRYIGQIAPRPVLIVHGTTDEVVPVEHAKILYEAAQEPKELVLLEGVLHRLRQEPRALDAAQDWLDKINKMGEVDINA
ncbi:alpha/beta hydrolase [Dethiobacter alkaliphilus]|uniref:2-hydroxy-6-oxohepta-2,4-dienoate hydrolase (TodF) n=1 Tax=Dethiobacter alkaliphilus AHT 1 TaxID=555088 RepID=C0GGI4_DETAL|nr:alpha/beta fold hydrolase [Dethiobacter alkaliphilus]EEG77425.1 2-hydroxy-6-oxohepta-2,4-dienoate hydrolase (TodF) [Dethiobacter alkaliphilus AHT 1]